MEATHWLITALKSAHCDGSWVLPSPSTILVRTLRKPKVTFLYLLAERDHFSLTLYVILSHRFSGLAFLSFSLVSPDNHCISALFSHCCGNHYGSWLPWQHTVPIPPSRTEGGIKQHALCWTYAHDTLLTHTSFALIVHAHPLSTQIAFNGKSKMTFRCYRGWFKKKLLSLKSFIKM